VCKGSLDVDWNLLVILGLWVAAVLAWPAGATAQSTTFAFPSSTSTVVGSIGFIDADEVGFFWTVHRGDRVSETFSGPSSVNRAILKVEVVRNVLVSAQEVDWNLEINGTVVGSFTVPSGFTGPLTLDVCRLPNDEEAMQEGRLAELWELQEPGRLRQLRRHKGEEPAEQVLGPPTELVELVEVNEEARSTSGLRSMGAAGFGSATSRV
jgi:hypothetical protein